MVGSQGAFAAYLRKIMKQNGLTSADALARYINVGVSTVRRWLKQTAEPTIDNLRAMAEAIRVPLRDLVVIAGLFTAEEMNTSGAPEPLPAQLERVRKLTGPNSPVPQTFKDILLRNVDTVVSQFLELFQGPTDVVDRRGRKRTEVR